MRSIEVLLKQDMEVKIVSLPEGEDPDSYVNKFGKDKFEDLMKMAENFIEYQTRYYDSLGKLNDPASAADAIREVVKSLALISDELKRDFLIKSIAKKFNLREKLLESELDKIIKGMIKRKVSENKVPVKPISEAGIIPEIEDLKKNNPVLYNLEKEIIVHLFEGERPVIKFIAENIAPEDFLIEAHQSLANMVIEHAADNDNVDADKLIEGIENDGLESYIREVSIDKHSISSRWDERNPGITPEMIKHKQVKDKVLKFKIIKIDEQIKKSHALRESAGNDDDDLELMSLIRMLEEEKKTLKENFDEIEIE